MPILSNEVLDSIAIKNNQDVLTGKEQDALRKSTTKAIDDETILNALNKAKEVIRCKDTSVEAKRVISTMSEIMLHYKKEYGVSIVKTRTEKVNEFQERMKAIYSTTSNTTSLSIHKIVSEIQTWLSKEHSDLLNKSDSDEAALERLRSLIENRILDKNYAVKDVSTQELIICIKNRITGLDILDDAVYRREDIDEIQMDDYNDIYYIIKGKRVESGISLSSPEDYEYLINAILRKAAQVGKPESISETQPFLRTRLGDTSRVTILAAPIAIRPIGVAKINAPYYQIVIRKQKADKLTIEKLIELGSLDRYSAYLLQLGVRCGISMLFYGGTGTGKSAGMGAVLAAIPKDRRTISMAEIEELNLRLIDMREYIMVDGKQIKNVRYKRPHNSVLQWELQTLDREIIKGKPGFTGGVNAALTMTPDCIIIQEAKGGEVKELSNAALSGHQSFTSIHAIHVKSLAMRYLLMYQESGVNIRDELILQQLPLSFQWLVQFKMFPGGFRAVADITEITGYDAKTNTLEENVLMRYGVESIKREIINKPDGTVEEKYTTIGHHYAVGIPTANSFEIMRTNGLLDTDYDEFRTMYTSPQTRRKTLADIKKMYEFTI